MLQSKTFLEVSGDKSDVVGKSKVITPGTI